VSVWSTIPPEIIGETEICIDAQETLSSPIANGVWTTDDPSILFIDPSNGEITNVVAGTATISYTVNQAGCIATNSVLFTINPLPYPGKLQGTDNLCYKYVGSFTSDVSSGVWASQDESIVAIDQYGNLLALSPGVTYITYTVTDDKGCTNHSSKDVNVFDLPNPGLLSGVDELCIGKTESLLSNAPMMFIVSQEWSSNQSNIVSVNENGIITGFSSGTATITYTVTDINNCSNSTTKTINVYSTHAGLISGVSSLSEGYSSVFVSTELGGTWSTSNTLASADSQTGKVTALSPGQTTVYYILSNMCGTDTARADLTITTSFENLATPQIISPNGDGANDLWIVDFLHEYPNNTVYLYNRWGTKVFEQKSYGPGKEFFGISNKGALANKLPNGTYFYIIDLNGDGKQLVKGYLELQR